MAKKLDTILAEAIVAKGLIAENDSERILQEAAGSGLSLQQFLLARGMVQEKELLLIIAEKLKLSFLNLKDLQIEKNLLEKVPIKIASYYRFIPVSMKGRILTVAVSQPLDIKTQDEIRTQLGYEIEMALACSEDVLDSLKKYYGLAADTLQQISQGVTTAEVSAQVSSVQAIEDIEKQAGDASVIRLVNQIILEGWKKRATDIHIEPQRDGLSLRYRIDGILYDSNVPGEIRNFINAIISRIKIMSNLNIVERRLPQDGRAIVKVAEQMLDLRISTIPTPFGESVVIRILPTQMLFGLEKLGLDKNELQIFEMLIQKPHGIIFVTGPTGSGKTTTLYASLSRINTRDRKIITIEDPIEYEMAGITQIQVMPEIGLDFARGLRSILRHDPDVIMVGEVRDLETAEIAIRVALTGHLVFSTLHTNDAPSGVTRLVDIGLEPYLVASSVEAFIGQRLIRVICSDCKYQDTKAPVELLELIAGDLGMKSSEIKIYRAKGCASCNFTGFFGRTAIYEILLIDEVIKELVIKKAPSGQIKKAAVAAGMRTLRQDGWQKVIAGISTPEEVMKVTSVEEHKESEERPFMPISWSASSNEAVNPLERRSFARLDSKISIHFKVIEAKDGFLKRGHASDHASTTKDISAGGLLFLTEEALAMGTILEVTIELPDHGEPVECLAKVARVEDAHKEGSFFVGICFLDITGGQRVRLNKYVALEKG